MQEQMKLSAEQLSSIKEQLDSTTSRLERQEKQYQEAAASELESRKSQSEPESHRKRIQELEETINRWHQLEKLEQNISLLKSQFAARLPVDTSSRSNFAREANSSHGTLKMAPLDGSNIASDSLATIRSALQESFNELIVPILRRVVQNESTEHTRADRTLTAHGIPFPPTERDTAPRASVEQSLWSKQVRSLVFFPVATSLMTCCKGVQQDCDRSNQHIHTRNIPSYAYTAQPSRSGQVNSPLLHSTNVHALSQGKPAGPSRK
ncbi:uncharacterized protein LAESUDRAFT_265085 [Laetiporus sulphureus 93-53]|uniref:Uncharacterized protein n=1 Tax=Laetiporus sulphureus 93-53 TaxID=1314785 RepID=A0A165H7D7_9APHY|nr:uncharacterized protein LAESUDRAFT_265085 [Laetiporus sulphureus 93-53]KZT11346.1 hypothetical protein LAESUDRAFT_265085 [Laetiporus sulphureus 93-53]